MTTNQNQNTEAMDYAGMAYKLIAITETISTPEQAAEMNDEAFNGVRIILDEAAATLLESGEAERTGVYRTGYKLLAVTVLMDTVERASELSYDTFSGIRIILDEVVASLFVASESYV